MGNSLLKLDILWIYCLIKTLN